MFIQLKKFGTTLISRQSGKEAFLAFSPELRQSAENEIIEVDFEGVNTFTPSWGDEFLSPLQERFGDRLKLRNVSNPSVQATLELLEDINKKKFVLEK